MWGPSLAITGIWTGNWVFLLMSSRRRGLTDHYGALSVGRGTVSYGVWQFNEKCLWWFEWQYVGKWQCRWLHPVSPVVGFALDTHHYVKPSDKVKGDDPGDLAVYGAGLSSLDCWDRYF
jgi:hypothetical protein